MQIQHIPAPIPRITHIPAKPALVREFSGMPKKKLVTAYCRVSTDSEEQLTSYEAQRAYYTEKINANREWKLVGIFADEGISGTRTKNRKEFLKLIELCKKGKVDLILIKSLSRFARNTVDSLNYIRALKAMGVGIIFEKENINTLEIDNEVMLTIHSCFAQAESESISQNVKWGKRQSFKAGKVTFQYARLLGYEKGEDGNPRIVPEQAEIVHRIFRAYLEGQSVEQIRTALEADGILTVTGKQKWSRENLTNILKNEKYIGDALLQKTYVADVLTKKTVKNNGELPQYYITDNHAAIIEREVFQRVQEEMARRSAKRRVAQKGVKTEQGKYSGKYALSELLYCGDCGTKYRRCTWSRNGVKRVVWRCINRLEYGPKYCKESPTIDEDKLQEAILRALNHLVTHSGRLQQGIQSSLTLACAGERIGVDAVALQQQIDQRSTAMMELVATELRQGAAAQDVERMCGEIAAEIETLKAQLQQHEQEQGRIRGENHRIKEIMALLDGESHDFTAYDDSLVRRMVESIRVVNGEKIVIRFGWGVEVEERIG